MTQRSVRLAADLYELAQARAAVEERSVAWIVNRAVRQVLAPADGVDLKPWVEAARTGVIPEGVEVGPLTVHVESEMVANNVGLDRAILRREARQRQIDSLREQVPTVALDPEEWGQAIRDEFTIKPDLVKEDSGALGSCDPGEVDGL